MANYISDEKFDLIVNLIVEDNGIRETARKAGVSKNTVRKIWREFWSYGGTPTPKHKKGGYWAHKKHNPD